MQPLEQVPTGSRARMLSLSCDFRLQEEQVSATKEKDSLPGKTLTMKKPQLSQLHLSIVAICLPAAKSISAQQYQESPPCIAPRVLMNLLSIQETTPASSDCSICQSCLIAATVCTVCEHEHMHDQACMTCRCRGAASAAEAARLEGCGIRVELR